MTSSQPIATPNALNFTPDNKGCYAFSGLMSIDDNETTMINCQTNSEYIKAKVQFNYPTSDGDNFIYRVYFNDIVVQAYVIDHSALYGYQNSVIYLIIPPFTAVKLTADNQGSNTPRAQICSITGEAIGMTETGFQ